ncbi:MAG: putative FAD-dependent oxidoreductase [Frankiales bacterium]|nr:putative FAD-dependent oxidoreductase [Frankiales bacterium]
MSSTLPVAVIGAGPVGLAAAAHLRSRGLPVVVLEAGDRVGTAVRGWGHVRTFTPWRYIVDPVAEQLLHGTGWTRPASPVPPTGDELAELYLEPLAAALGSAVRTGARVVAVTRDGMDKARTVGRSDRPFLLRLASGEELRARAVLDASGTWEQPAPLGAGGLPAHGEQESGSYLVGALPDVLGRDRARFAGRRTLVVGGGHSAANTLLALGKLAEQEPGTSIVWAVRGGDPQRVYGGGEADELEARGRLGSDLQRLVDSGAIELVTGFATTALEVDGDTVTVLAGDRRIESLHNVAAATGFRPDLSILSEVQLDLHPALEAPTRLAPLVDPQFHSCGTVPPHGHRDLAQPDEGLYLVGMKSYGRAPTFLITTGNEQVRSIAAALAGDLAAADAVHLELPETGVCSVGPTGEALTSVGGCCGDDTHRARPEDVPAQGFVTGVPGGGLVAASAGGGCCAG